MSLNPYSWPAEKLRQEIDRVKDNPDMKTLLGILYDAYLAKTGGIFVPRQTNEPDPALEDHILQVQETPEGFAIVRIHASIGDQVAHEYWDHLRIQYPYTLYRFNSDFGSYEYFIPKTELAQQVVLATEKLLANEAQRKRGFAFGDTKLSTYNFRKNRVGSSYSLTYELNADTDQTSWQMGSEQFHSFFGNLGFDVYSDAHTLLDLRTHIPLPGEEHGCLLVLSRLTEYGMNAFSSELRKAQKRSQNDGYVSPSKRLQAQLHKAFLGRVKNPFDYTHSQENAALPDVLFRIETDGCIYVRKKGAATDTALVRDILTYVHNDGYTEAMVLEQSSVYRNLGTGWYYWGGSVFDRYVVIRTGERTEKLKDEAVKIKDLLESEFKGRLQHYFPGIKNLTPGNLPSFCFDISLKCVYVETTADKVLRDRVINVLRRNGYPNVYLQEPEESPGDIEYDYSIYHPSFGTPVPGVYYVINIK